MIRHGETIMTMTNAERQSRFRKRRKSQGLKRRDAWQDTAYDGGKSTERAKKSYYE
jgi:hypothetical protein